MGKGRRICPDQGVERTNCQSEWLQGVIVLLIHHAGEKQAPTPYVVNVTVPVQGYDPVSFILAKHCGMDS